MARGADRHAGQPRPDGHPFSVTAYTAKTIENQQSGTVGAVLRNDPSIRFSTGEGHAYENFMIRGYALDSTELALGGLYGLAPDGHVPTEFLERVEVLKGPGALLNGMAPNGGVGGVVNLVPKRAGEAPLTRLTSSYVSDGYVAEHVDIGRRFADGRFGVRFNGVYGSGDTGVNEQSRTVPWPPWGWTTAAMTSSSSWTPTKATRNSTTAAR